MKTNQTTVLGIACEQPTAHDVNAAALKAVSKCERIVFPTRLGPPDPLETLRVMQGSPTRDQFVKFTLARVVETEAVNPELQRRAAQAVVAYCQRHGVAVPTDVRKCASSPVQQPVRKVVTATPVQKTVPASGHASSAEQTRKAIAEQNVRIADLKRRLSTLTRGSR